MHFTINLAFVNYCNDSIEELGIPVSQNWTTQEQILPLLIETFEISANLLNALKTLRDLTIQYQNKRKILDKKDQKLDKTKEIQNSNNFLIVFWQTCFHSQVCTCNHDHNISHSIYYVWTIKIESFGNKHSDAMH